jgi:thiol-disulfide isomerase/thioredoxin
MKPLRTALLLMFIFVPAFAQDSADGPTDPKAQKTYKEGLDYLHRHLTEMALGDFKKADKQDGGHCVACQKKMIELGKKTGDWKVAELGAEEQVVEAKGEKDTALSHYDFGQLLLDEGVIRRKDEMFARAHDEFVKALAAFPNFPAAIFGDGRAFAYLKQDDAAKARFEEFVKMRSLDDVDRERALRYISQPELARARMAPPFSVTTLDGQRISMDDLKGKVVLIDFWATWCAPCREALPHMRDIAKKFNGQPLVILSVSLDADEKKWKEFVEKNGMTWAQYRDAGFEGPIAREFAVTAIPHTFTIDTDGVLQDEHIGDASIEGKLKKLIARARELDAAKPVEANVSSGR